MNLQKYDFYFSKKQYELYELIGKGNTYVNGKIYTACRESGKELNSHWGDEIFIATDTMDNVTIDKARLETVRYISKQKVPYESEQFKKS